MNKTEIKRKKAERRRLSLTKLMHEKCNGKLAELAVKIECSDSYASRMLYEEGKPGKKNIGEDMVDRINRAFNVDLDSIDMTSGKVNMTHIDNGGSPEYSNVSPLKLKHQPPVISWVAAGKLTDIEVYLLSEDVERLPTDYKCAERCFWLLVDGDSMTSSNGKDSFPMGCHILVDTDLHAKAGDYVIAKDIVTQQATFKRLMHDAGRWYLRPLNPGYETQEIDDPAVRVIGVVKRMRPQEQCF